MNPNAPEDRGGLPAVLRAIAMFAVLALAAIGILAVTDVIPREMLSEWLTKTALVLLIVAAAIVAIWTLGRSGTKP